MAFNLQAYSRMSARIDNSLLSAGSLELPVNIEVDGDVYQEVATIANGANTTIYNDDLGTFKYLRIESDFDVRVLLTDSAASTFNLQLKGTGTSGKYGIPLELGLDETLNASTTLTTLQVFNTSGSSAKVKVVVVD